MKHPSLEEYPVVKCIEGEKILCVQRQHPIILITRMFVQIILLCLILTSFLLIFYSFSYLLPFGISNAVIFYLVVTVLSAFFVVGLYTYMSWYYQFYVITNKALIHKFAFRITGPFSETVFGEKMHIQEIDRRPQNLIYDFLRIQDVHVYFHKLEREEPFVFKTPSNSQAIEDILDSLITQSHATQGGA